MTRALCGALAICLLPLTASAQTSDAALDLGAAAQASQGPMTVERIHNGFLAAPDFKVTNADTTLGRVLSDAAKTQLKSIEQALETYEVDMAGYPKDLNQLTVEVKAGAANNFDFDLKK